MVIQWIIIQDVISWPKIVFDQLSATQVIYMLQFPSDMMMKMIKDWVYWVMLFSKSIHYLEKFYMSWQRPLTYLPMFDNNPSSL